MLKYNCGRSKKPDFSHQHTGFRVKRTKSFKIFDHNRSRQVFIK